MLLERIEKSLIKIQENLNKDEFIYDFLEAYEQPKSSIKRLKDGDYNLSKKPNEVIWKKKIYFYSVNKNEDIHEVIDNISKSEIVEKNKIRFIIITDFKEFLSVDKKNNSTLDIEINQLSKNVDFFLPLLGLEKSHEHQENHADIKAAYKMGKLYDLLLDDNNEWSKNDINRRSFNIFFSRILFCLFAQDSNIFDKNLFTTSISSHTLEDGSDLDIYLDKLFKSLNIKNKNDFPNYLKLFPYVNGGLFKDVHKIPKISSASRKILIECSELDWKAINPDIFGSMMQAVVHHGERKNLGMHYTSLNNILKVIKPLFLDDLYDIFYKSGDDKNKLNNLLKKIYNLKIFDPACGSGNFLIVAYKEIYKLEIEILKKLKEIDKNDWLILNSGIRLSQFYGIEIDDYAHEIAKLSLWIAEHQMNVIYNEILDENKPSLPLTDAGNIVCKNALDFNWEKFCTFNDGCEIFVIGNPPYLGYTKQTKEHKADIDRVFNKIKGSNILDYISCWFYIGSKYVSKTNAKLGFVSTNSIIQGEQVSILWPTILKDNIEIFFAYKGFNWSNNAKNKAGVTCVIIGLINQKKYLNKKKLFFNNQIKDVKNINAYLFDGPNIIVKKENSSISNLPKMSFGNMPLDNGNLILSNNEKEELLEENKKFNKFIRPLIGAEEYINGKIRYCIWIKDNELDEAIESNFIKKRIEKVKIFRTKSKRTASKRLAQRAHQFADINESKNNSLIIPRHTSERRKYLITGFLDKNIIIPDSSRVIYDPPTYILPIISSRLHNLWANFVGGFLQTTPRYSITLSYNTFPIPHINNEVKNSLDTLCFKLIDEREKFSEKTLADIYDPNYMPESIKKIHLEIDGIIDEILNINSNWEDDKKIVSMLETYKKLKNIETLI
jgi:type II restriction/modification system DNA methylase subunit YeeA